MKLALAILLSLQATAVAQPVTGAVQQLNGAHGLRNEQFGLFLRPRDASNRDGEPIVLYPYQPWKCMAWHFENMPNGTRLVNFFTGKSFEMQGSSSSEALIQMPATTENRHSESFHFVALEQGLYEIRNEKGDALTAVDSDGHGDIRVVVSPWKNLATQRWQLVDIPDHFTM
jgi:hypothetical protein